MHGALVASVSSCVFARRCKDSALPCMAMHLHAAARLCGRWPGKASWHTSIELVSFSQKTTIQRTLDCHASNKHRSHYTTCINAEAAIASVCHIGHVFIANPKACHPVSHPV